MSLGTPRYTTRYKMKPPPLQMAKKACYERNRARQRFVRLRGRDSNPNFLVQSQASCR